jgi:hypothetical protein
MRLFAIGREAELKWVGHDLICETSLKKLLG